ncbi:MAG: N-acetyltransferase, partial [Gammaproteobacteria bacterium]
LKINYPRTARIPLMGVRKKLHNTRLGPGLALSVVLALQPPGLRKGLEEVEMSWILEDNEAMKNMIESLGGYVSKRYRIYEKNIA